MASSKNVNPVAGSASKGGNLETQSAADTGQHFTSENLLTVVKGEFGQINARGLRAIAACTVDIAFHVVARDIAMKAATANLARSIVGADNNTPMAKINGTVRSHVSLAGRLAKHLANADWAAFDVNGYSTITAAVDFIYAGLVADFGTVENMKAKYGKGGKASATKTIVEKIFDLLDKATGQETEEILSAVMSCAGFYQLDLTASQAIYSEAKAKASEHTKANVESEAKAKAAPFTPQGDGGPTIDDLAAGALADIVSAAKTKAALAA